MRRTTFVVLGLTVVLVAGAALAQTIPNWTAPPTWTPTKGLTASALSSDLSGPMPFIPITPCRVADTRAGSGFAGQYGPPSLSPGNRDFTITGQCGIPSGAVAVSFNFHVIDMSTTGDLRTFPAGSTMPLVATMTWTGATGVISNAAVVPLSTGGAITVHLDGASTIDLIIDVNGYYSSTPASTNTFLDIHTGASAPYAARFVTDGFYDGIYIECTSTAWGIETVVPDNGAWSGHFSGGLGVYAAVSNPGSKALQGLSSATTGVNYGVYGEISSTTNGAAGVFGHSSGTTGVTYGVLGTSPNITSNSAAVKATAGSPNLGSSSYVYAGVRGEAGTGGWGVLAISNHIGLGAYHLNASTGAIETSVWLAGDATTAISGTGNFSVTGTKSFVEPHPTDPTKVIKYVALEGPEAGTYFRGKGRFVGRTAVIAVPESFRLVTDAEGLTVQVTPIGDLATVAVVSIGLDQIELKSSRDVEFFYTVNGVREAFKDFQPIQDNEEYKPMTPKDTMPTALSAEQKRILIKTGIFNEDGTVNLNTAERLGWAQQWRDRDAQLKVAAEAAAAKQGEAVRAGQRQNENKP